MQKPLIATKPLSPVLRATLLLWLAVVSLGLAACDQKNGAGAPGAATQPAPGAGSPTAEQLVERLRAIDNSRNSAMKVRARIEESAGSKEILMNMYRKREADGSLMMLAELVSPAAERDRAGLIRIGPGGEVEATRFAQANNSFVTTTSVAGEDSLFGMSLQELVGGQVEKYDHRLVGEETIGSTPVYKTEGKLKEGAESKFPRLVLLISKENNALLVGEFYDVHNEMARRLTVDKLEQVDGHWTRMHWTVDNVARRKQIKFETLSAKYDDALSDSLFTREHLKKIASK